MTANGVLFTLLESAYISFLCIFCETRLINEWKETLFASYVRVDGGGRAKELIEQDRWGRRRRDGARNSNSFVTKQVVDVVPANPCRRSSSTAAAVLLRLQTRSRIHRTCHPSLLLRSQRSFSLPLVSRPAASDMHLSPRPPLLPSLLILSVALNGK